MKGRVEIVFFLSIVSCNTGGIASQANTVEHSLKLHQSDFGNGSGALEITYNGTSGAICPNGWDNKGALVACRELGFEHGWMTLSLKKYSNVEGPYLISNVNCSGTETTLEQCSLTPFHELTKCQNDHRYDQVAGVSCHFFDVQLYPDPENPYGAVVFNNTDGSRLLCSDGFDQNAATVVCKQLGFRYGLAACCSAFGPLYSNPDIRGKFTAHTIKCTGEEQHLRDCIYLNEGDDTTCAKSVSIGNECLQFCRTTPGAPCDVSMQKFTRCTWSRYAGVVCSDDKRGVSGISADPIVKINYYTHDGHICSEGFTDKDATVICKDIGFLYGIGFAAASISTLHGIRWLREPGCSGTESSITECKHLNWGQTESCQWDSVAAVMCSNNQGDLDVKLRVVDGQERNTPEDTSISGRVEIFLNGKWGTICGQYINLSEARVLCRHLGYLGAKILPAGRYGPGAGDVILSGIDCEGDEESIRDCVWYGYAQNFCDHSTDAAISCFKTVRLTNTKFENYGVLEMFDYGFNFPYEFWNQTEDSIRRFDSDWMSRNSVKSLWWTVCDSNININPASICKQWGFTSGEFRSGSTLGQPTSGLSEVERYCDDYTDQACQYTTFSKVCASGKHIALYCGKTDIEKEEFAIIKPKNSFYGPVELKRYGKRGYICSDGFDDADAQVICSELGYSSGTAVVSLTDNLEIIQGDLDCKGDEEKLEECKRGSFEERGDCFIRDRVAAVLCYTTKIRFVNTVEDKTAPANIALEITVDNSKLFVSTSNFDDVDASVYCRSTGWAGGKIATNNGRPNRQIHISDLKCFGNESSILKCPANWDPGLASGDYGFKAVANCRPPLYLTEAFYGAVVLTTRYGTGLMSVKNFNETDAQSVCRSLGFDEGLDLCCDPFGRLPEQMFLTDFHCTESQMGRMDNCSYEIADSYGNGFQQSTNYASAICFNGILELEYSLSINQGAVFGPLNLKYMNVNGLICNDGWDDRAADVACRQLGLKGGMAYKGTNTNLTGPFWTSNIDCKGTEVSLKDCSMTSFGKVKECKSIPSFASVICRGNEGIQYRFARNDSQQGTIEMGLNRDWRTLCADTWTDENAEVLCRMFGYATGQKTEIETSAVHWNFSFKCNRTSASLNDCLSTESTCQRHNLRAGAFCYQSAKLANVVGREKSYGEVMLYHDGRWHYMCSDGFRKASAQVVCKELGFADGDTKCCSDEKSLEAVSILQTHKAMCSGKESNISECLVKSSCESPRPAYVTCYSTAQLESEAGDEETGVATIAITVVVTVLAVVGFVIIVGITVFCVRRKQRRQHNLTNIQIEYRNKVQH